MAEVAMGQKASYIPAEGDDAGRETPAVTEAVAHALDRATVPSKVDIEQPQTETVETQQEPPGKHTSTRVIERYKLIEPLHQKTNEILRRKQRRKSAV